MVITNAPTPTTAEELLTYRVPGKRTELVRGRLRVREPASFYHGVVASRVLIRLGAWLEADRVARGASEQMGDVLATDTGFTLARRPDTVRAPDVAFVYTARRPANMRGYPDLAPDFAVEVRSPHDRTGEVLAKVGDWLTAGTTLVWVIDADRSTAQEYRADGTVTLREIDDVLVGDPVLPGFQLSLVSLLAR
jgi:Uma2 family endonuclease